MKVTINNEVIDARDGITLSELLAERSIDLKGKAVAVNGAVLPRDKKESYCPADNDKIIIIQACYGG
ncbi:MAG: sulfur carrier protein ThiS [Bacteroides sp.]|nr:sulfur carrier protein ThiS [Bacteroides sp.]MCM1414165.1 sulfur carrier protein ThiS [Bacteroides sp.]MCM1471285.1 sulfur carrier protein ThiS [Bacteroides sp.]